MSVKHDNGKTRPSLVLLSMSRALQSVSEVATFGADKYTDDGWREVPDGVRRYTDAMLRHLLAEASGEVNDPESGLPHAAHIAWNALARLDLELRAQMALAPASAAPSTGDLMKAVMTAAETGEPIRIPPPAPPALDGIYDNLRTFRRERWVNNRLLEWECAHLVRTRSDHMRGAWGRHPDLPRQ